MARQVPGQPAGQTRQYVPPIDGNDRDPEPVTVTIRNPTEAEKRAFYAGMRTSVRLDANGKPLLDADGKPVVHVDTSGADWQRRALDACVVSVVNYIGTNGEPITSGAQLWEHGEVAFVEDIAAEAITGFSLSEDAKKKSAKLFDSTPATTTACDGTAENARGSDSTASEDVSPEAA